MEGIQVLNAETSRGSISSPGVPSSLPKPPSTPLSNNSNTGPLSVASNDSGDTIMEQGAPEGPPVKDWVFSEKTQQLLDKYDSFVQKHNLEPSGPRLTEDYELWCECNGFDDGTLIKCSNGVFCLKERFHMACVGVKPPGPAAGEEWYCRRCLFFEKGGVLKFKHRKGLPLTEDILAAAAAESTEPKRELIAKLPVTPKIAAKIRALETEAMLKVVDPIIPTPGLLSIIPDLAARTELFAMTSGVSTVPSKLPPPIAIRRRKSKKVLNSLEFPITITNSTAATKDNYPKATASDTTISGTHGRVRLNTKDVLDAVASVSGVIVDNVGSVVAGENRTTPSGRAFTPKLAKKTSWSVAEEGALTKIMADLLKEVPKLSSSIVFERAADQMRQKGFDRKAGGISNYWARYLRAFTGLDERSRNRNTGLQTSVYKPKSKGNVKTAEDREAEPAIKSAPAAKEKFTPIDIQTLPIRGGNRAQSL